MKFLFLFILLLLIKPVYSNLDSLQKILENKPGTEQKASALIALAEHYAYSNVDSFYYFSMKGYKHGIQSNHPESISKSADNLGFIHRNRAAFDSSLYYYQIALREVDKSTEEYPGILYSTGNLYRAMDSLELASVFFLRSQKVSREKGFAKGEAIASLGLGSLSISLKDYEDAATYFETAEKKFQKINDSRGVYISRNNLALCYLGNANYEAAKTVLENVVLQAEELNDKTGLTKACINLCYALDELGEFEKLAFYAKKSLNLSKELEMKEDEVKAYHNLSLSETRKGNFDNAKAFLDTALSIINQIDSKEEYKQNWSYRVIMDTAKGDYKQAFFDQLKYMEYRGEIEDVDVRNEINELKEKYHTEHLEYEKLQAQNAKRQQELKTVKAENELRKSRLNLFWIIIISTIVLALGMIFYFRMRFKQRNEKLKSEIALREKEFVLQNKAKAAEIKAIKSQMNPHFIFNALNSIQSLIWENDFRKSNKYLGRFSELVRTILDSSDTDFIPLDKEIQLLQLYLDLEELRFPNNFEISFQVNIEENQKDHILLPPLLIQPYIENAIKHGLMHKEGNKSLGIAFFEKENRIIVEIKDNGIGYEAAGQLKNYSSHHKSFATQANQKRVDLINEIHHLDITVEVNSQSSGTTVCLSFPFMTSD